MPRTSTHSKRKPSPKIAAVEPTSECLTDRGGLTLFSRYIASISIAPMLHRLFGRLRKSSKGMAVTEMFRQLICYFADGTNLHLTRFDELARDGGYAAAIEAEPSAMASSHAVKRFLAAFSYWRIYSFRKVLQTLFMWRLAIEQPQAIILDIDTTVLDNDDAKVREGVQPTYKKCKGFQPLQMTWNRYVVDAVFRGGKKHSNHGKTVVEMVRHVVERIRREYRSDVPIVLTMDAGFFDAKNFIAFEALGIGYICCGKMYGDIQAFAASSALPDWEVYRCHKTGQEWEILPMGSRRGCWKRFRRALYCRKLTEGHQYVLPFARCETVIYTSLGVGLPVDEMLRNACCSTLLEDSGIIEQYHQRGTSELANRALKDFGTEHLPFKRFESNSAFYYTMLLSYNLFDAFKKDVCASVISPGSYATTVRRRLIDIAGKVVRTGGRMVLKIATAVWEQLDFGALWERANRTPVIRLEYAQLHT